MGSARVSGAVWRASWLQFEICLSGGVARSRRQMSIGPAPSAPMGTRGTCAAYAGGEAASIFHLWSRAGCKRQMVGRQL